MRARATMRPARCPRYSPVDDLPVKKGVDCPDGGVEDHHAEKEKQNGSIRSGETEYATGRTPSHLVAAHRFVPAAAHRTHYL